MRYVTHAKVRRLPPITWTSPRPSIESYVAGVARRGRGTRVLPAADLYTGGFWAGDELEAGDAVRLAVHLNNLGDDKAGPFSIAVWIGRGAALSVPVGGLEVPSLPPTGVTPDYVIVDVALPPDGDPYWAAAGGDGDYWLTAVADPGWAVDETDESENIAGHELRIRGTGVGGTEDEAAAEPIPVVGTDGRPMFPLPADPLEWPAGPSADPEAVDLASAVIAPGSHEASLEAGSSTGPPGATPAAADAGSAPGAARFALSGLTDDADGKAPGHGAIGGSSTGVGMAAGPETKLLFRSPGGSPPGSVRDDASTDLADPDRDISEGEELLGEVLGEAVDTTVATSPFGTSDLEAGLSSRSGR